MTTCVFISGFIVAGQGFGVLGRVGVVPQFAYGVPGTAGVSPALVGMGYRRNTAGETPYRKSITNVKTESQTFIDEHVPRSRVRRIGITDFAENLLKFATSRFEPLSSLTIQDVLLRSPDLMTEEQASLRLDELDRAATPLLLLSEMDLNDDTFAQKDLTNRDS